MAAEREIKTVLTLDDASFSKGLKAATASATAAREEMNAAVASASGLGKGFKKYAAQTSGLSKTLKAEKQQMAVLNKEYKTQQSRLKDLSKALKDATRENGAGSDEAKKAANAYASQSAQVDELRTKMARLSTQMAKTKQQLTNNLTKPLQMAGAAAKIFAVGAVAAFTAVAAALVKLGSDSLNARETLAADLSASQATFEKWSAFLEQEADDAWKNAGLSKSAYLEAAVELGNTLQAMGADVGQSAELSAGLIQAAANLAGQYGTTTEAALKAIQDAANGSKKSMLRYGISLDDTKVKQWALDKKLISATDDLDKEQLALFAVQMIMEKAEKAQDGYATRTDNVAAAVERAGAAWDNFLSGAGSAEDVSTALDLAIRAFGLKVKEIGPQLVTGIKELLRNFTKELPSLITEATPILDEFIAGVLDILTDNPEEIGAAAGTLVGTLAASIISHIPDMALAAWKLGSGLISGVDKAVQSAWKSQIYPALQKLLHVAFGVDLPDWDTVVSSAQTWWDTNIKPAVDFVADYFVAAGQTIQDAADTVSAWWDGVSSWIAKNETLQAMFSIVGDAWENVKTAITGWWDDISPKIRQQGILRTVFQAVGDTWENFSASVSSWWSDIDRSIQENGLLTTIFHVIGDAWGKVRETVAGWWNVISAKIQNSGLVQATIQAVGDAWNNVKAAVSGWWSTEAAPRIEREGLLGTVFHVFGDAWAGVRDTVSSWWSAISAKLQKEKILQAAVQAIGDSWENVKTAVTDWWDNSINPKIQESGGLLQAAFHIAGEAWESVRTTVSAWWASVSEKLQSSKILQTVFTAVGQDWENFKTAVTGWWDGIKDKLSGIVAVFFSVKYPGQENVKKDITDWWAIMSTKVAGIVSTMFGITFPTWDEISASWDEFWGNAYSNLPGWLKDILNFFGLGGGTEPVGSTILNTATKNLAGQIDSASDSIKKLGNVSAAAVSTISNAPRVNSQEELEAMGVHSAEDLLNLMRYGTVGGQNAGGAWNVPFDRYIARLHTGEMVLTADQARRYRAQAAAGGTTYNDSAAIYIDKYNQYSGADADGLLQMMQVMQRRQRMGYGLA